MKVIWAAFATMAVLWTEPSLAASAAAPTQQLIDWCANKGNAFSPEQRIAACSGLIEMGKVVGRGLDWAYANRCVAYNDNNENDRAIADCNLALEYEPTATAFIDRGIAYYAKGDADRAIMDFSQAIQLDPKNAFALSSRAKMYYAKGDNERAIADYSQIVQLEPRDAYTYLGRALAEIYVGALPNARADLDRSSALDPGDSYTALWIEIVNKRSHLVSRLAEASKSLDMTKWPAPVIRLYLGRMAPAALLAAAADANPNTNNGQLCEAYLYSGEWSLQREKRDEAMRMFSLAVAQCPKSFLEYGAANAELKALHGTP